MYLIYFVLTILSCPLLIVQGCGITTHMLISTSARDYFSGNGDTVDYRSLMFNHHDAFQAGSAFPDSFYSNLCSNGTYHQVSEDTHWTPFLNTSINYVRKNFPQPWSKETERLVAFIFGMMSHQVSDVLWHSLGIDHGFIQTLAAVDFHGDYDMAHKAADLGGDVVAIFDMDARYEIDPESDWYVPTKDLFEIYKEYYGSVKIDEDTIGTCSTLLVIASIAELFGLPELYQVVAETSPFLENQMEDYFLGGVNDMIGWTHRMWDNGVTLFEKGPSACHLPHNPLFIQCNAHSSVGSQNTKSTNGFFVQPNLNGLTIDNLEIQESERGISIRPNAALKSKLSSRQQKRKMQKTTYKETVEPLLKTGVYAVNSSNAKLGWSMAIGDMDGDGFTDFIAGAPGYSRIGSPQEGRVYIVYGNDSKSLGFGYSEVDIDVKDKYIPLNVTAIHGYVKKQSRYGSGVAVLDINLDGILDLAVGSPAYWIDSPLEYKGLVSIMLGKKGRRSYPDIDLVITCQSINCNLGYNLDAGDIDGDGNDDLIMGLPYYTGMYNQSGIVAAISASKSLPFGPGKTIAFEDIKWKQSSNKEQLYAWFGYKTVVKKQTLAISSPNIRKCDDPSCAFSPKDIQEIGRAEIFNYGHMSPIQNLTLLGTVEQESAGYSLDFGYLYDSHTLILAVGFPGMKVEGMYWTLPVNITRAGAVILYNMSTPTPTEIAIFKGNRRYAGFGSLVQIVDVNGDGTDDLLIGEPSRNQNKAEIINEEDGLVYVFYGGSKFPKGDATVTSQCGLTKPCANKIADLVTSRYDYEGVNNGYGAKVMKSNNEMILFTSDVRYPYSPDIIWAGHRSGGIHHYYVNRP